MKYKNYFCNDERGVALAFIAVAMIAILGMVGLAIDTYIATTSKSQYQAAADAAALAAIEEFTQNFSTGTLSVEQSIDNALLTAQNIVQKNTELLLSSASLKKNDQSNIGTGTTPAANGNIQPGFWINEESDTNGDGRECGAGNAPCFQPWLSGDLDAPNTFQVNIKLDSTSSIRTSFMGMFGVDSYGLAARATATMIRRQGIFMIDLSPSVHETSHSASPPQYSGGDSGVTADKPCGIYDDEADPSIDPKQHTLYAYPIDGTCNVGDTIKDPDKIFNKSDNPPTINPHCIFKHLPSLSGGTPVDGWSYKEDFQCVQIPNYIIPPGIADTDWDGNRLNKFFAVDVRRKPEPLFSLLKGINKALSIFEQRAASGDKIGVFGFDNRADGFLNARSTSLEFASSSGEGQPRIVGFDTAAFSEMKSATDVGNNSRSHFNKFLFPQFFENNPATSLNTRKPVNTDIESALRFSRDILRLQPEFATSDNFVVLFSDGKSNCDFDSGSLTCSGLSASKHKSSIIEAVNYVRDVFTRSDENISFHTILVGESVRPHTLLRSNPDKNGCLDDLTSRRMLRSDSPKKNNFKFVDYGSGSGDDFGFITGDYAFPNYLYQGVTQASGLWNPLREPCMLGVDLMDTTAASTGSAGALARACQGTSTPGNLLKNTSSIDNPQVKAALDQNNFLDSKGRLLCDPEGRSKDQQIEDFVTLLMQQNPIRLVGRTGQGF